MCFFMGLFAEGLFLLAKGVIFRFEITFSENFQFFESVGGWFWSGVFSPNTEKGESEKLTKGQFILFTLIKSYVPSCSIFQLLGITFLLLFVLSACGGRSDVGVGLVLQGVLFESREASVRDVLVELIKLRFQLKRIFKIARNFFSIFFFCKFLTLTS